MTRYKIFDDVPQEIQEAVRKTMFSRDFTWSLFDGVSSGFDPGVKMSKTILRWGGQSKEIPQHHMEVLYSIPKWLFQLNILYELISYRANITYRNLVPEHDFHTDSDHPSVMAGIYYATDTNGGTEFEDGTVIPGKQGTLAVFPANALHRPEGHTEGEDARVILNLNFLPNVGWSL